MTTRAPLDGSTGFQTTDPQSTGPTALIQALYEVAVNPQAYDRLLELWGAHLDAALEKVRLEAASADHAALTQEHQIVTEDLADHVLRAFEILDRLGRNATPSALSEQQARACLSLDRQGRITDCNRSAAALFGCSVGDALSDLAMTPESTRRLRALAVSGRPREAHEVFLFFSGQEAYPHPMILSDPEATATGQAEQLTLVALHREWTSRHDQVLQRLFGLTEAETRVARETLNGTSLPELAEEMGRSVDTLRTQMKSIRRKTFTANQTQLVRIMTGLEALSGPERPDSPADENGAFLSLPGGRRLQYFLLGPPGGLPCVFFHNMLNGPMFPAPVHQALQRENIRLICPVRPGFGASDPDPVCVDDPMQQPDRMSADVAALLDHLGIERVVALGYMSGSVLSFRLAQLLRARVRAVVNVAGGVPLRSLSQIFSMNGRQRTLALTARLTPRLLPTLLRAGMAHLDNGGEEAFLKALYPVEGPDHALAERPENRSVLYQGYRQILQQGHNAFALDGVHVIRDWSEYCRGLSVPVLLLHGAQDPVVSASSVQKFADDFGFECELFPDAGQLILYHDPGHTLRGLKELIARSEHALSAKSA